jgi:amino acid transporter
MAADTPSSEVSRALARDRLGARHVAFFALASIAPLLVTAGLMPSAYAATGLTNLPAAVLVMAIVLMVFCLGYAAIVRHVPNAGAFYALISRGLGRPLGVGAALVALVAYNLLQVGIYGLFGPTMASYAADNFDLHAAWWVWSLIAWAVVGALGLVRVEINGRVLAVFSCLEILVIVALTTRGLMHPAGGRIEAGSLSPLSLVGAGFAPLLLIALTAFVGFEQPAVYSEEARDRRHTVPRATYLVLGGTALLYAACTFAMNTFYGSRVVTVAQNQSSAMLFALGPGLLASAARTLLLTSLFAGLLAFHNACWRYTFSLGRERVLPAMFGRTGQAGVPRSASLVQSVIGLAAIGATLAFGWDPVGQLFYWGGTTGGFGVLVLLAATSFAVVGFFRRDRRGESALACRISPMISGVVLTVMTVVAIDHFALLLGVPSTSSATVLLPAVFAVAALVGIGWALLLRYRAPHIYAVVGLGPDAATHPATTVSPNRPAPLAG